MAFDLQNTSYNCLIFQRFQSNTHTRLTALFPGLPGWASTRKVKPIWILLKQEAMSGSGISWAICKSAPRSRQTTTPAPHHSVFYRPDALPTAQPTASKHWRNQHRHRIDKCMDTLLANQTARKVKPRTIAESRSGKMADCPSYYVGLWSHVRITFPFISYWLL